MASSNRQNKIHGGLLVAFLLFVIVFIGYHLWSYLHQPYETEVVGETTLVDEIQLDGFFVRDEQVVDGSDTGVLKCNYPDGQRVRQGSVLASVYASQQEQINLQLIEEYEEEYTQLQNLSSEGTVKGSRIDIVVKQIEQLQSEYVAQIESGNYTKAKDIKDSLTYQLNKLQICKGEVTDYTDAMRQLQNNISALNADSEAISTITAPINGYFSSKTDGLEQQLSLDAVSTLTAAQVSDLLEQRTTGSSGIGKIVTSNYWCYCAVTETSELTQKLSVGQSITLQFHSLGSSDYTLTLIRLEEDDSGHTLMVFQSSVMNKDFINARFEKASITVSSYEGIGINKQALRFQNGEKGVYIVRGSILLFKKVDPVYEDEDIIISQYTTDASYVSLYDNVVIGGEMIGGS